MIGEQAIVEWRREAPWGTNWMVEQGRTVMQWPGEGDSRPPSGPETCVRRLCR